MLIVKYLGSTNKGADRVHNKYIIIKWKVSWSLYSTVTNREKTLIFEFNVPEYHTAENFPDERVYIKVTF